MAAAVYALCALTSLVCAALLLRSYWKNGMRLLLWSGLCFVGLTVENLVLFFDFIVFPDVDLSLPRRLAGLGGLLLLVFGLVWDAR